VPGPAGAPGRRVAALQDKRLWRRIEFYVEQARALEDFSGVRTVGIDETSLRRGQHYITVVHDLDPSGCCSPPRGATTDGGGVRRGLKAHGGDPAQVRHVCMDMSAAYAKGVALALPKAQISYDRFHVVRWPSRRWMRCAARRWPPTRRRCARRWALASKTAAAVGHARNPGSWSARRSRRCTGCSARRSRARGRGG
jgi:transposase